MESEALKAFLEDALKAELLSVAHALQSVNSDAMGFGRSAAKQFHSAAAWEAYDWKADYRSMQIAFTVNMMLSHSPHDPETE